MFLIDMRILFLNPRREGILVFLLNNQTEVKSQLPFAQFRKIFMKQRQRLNSFLVIINIILFFWRVQRIAIQTKAKKHRFDT